ncbi:hypothetical protein QCA50_013714 [Cerrena zonata]|uniref:Uncharacterized protein n=1 Tax=Cerrena zonata TaxID=2478898 RepID=A0AAW0FUQ7_9APHY
MLANLQRTQSTQSVQSYQTFQTCQSYQSNEQTRNPPPIPTLRRPHLVLPHASSLSIVTNNSSSTSSPTSGSGSSAYSIHDLHSVNSSAASTHSSVDLDPASPHPPSPTSASFSYPSYAPTSPSSVESYSTQRSSPSHRMMASNNHIRQNVNLPHDQKSFVSATATTLSLPTVYEDSERRRWVVHYLPVRRLPCSAFGTRVAASTRKRTIRRGRTETWAVASRGMHGLMV